MIQRKHFLLVCSTHGEELSNPDYEIILNTVMCQISAGGFQLNKSCHFRETDILLRPNPRRVSVGEGNILLMERCQAIYS